MKRRNAVKMTAMASVFIGAMALIVPSILKAAGGEIYPFLKAPVSARVAGLGETSASTVEGVESLYHNPAGMALADRWQMASYNLIASEYYKVNHIAALAPIGRNASFGLGFMGLTQDAFEKTDNQGNPAGSFEASDAMVNLGLAYRLGSLSLGGSGKVIRSEIDSTRSQSWALDLGMQKEFSRGIVLGASLTNLGPKARYAYESASLPSELKAGVSYPLANLSLSGEVSRSLTEGESRFNMGAEYKITIARESKVALRGGYRPVEQNLGGDNVLMKGFRSGFGLQLKSLNVDYAVTPFADLGLNHRFSLGFAFGKKRG